jgi:RNA recognition motif-containing protein
MYPYSDLVSLLGSTRIPTLAKMMNDYQYGRPPPDVHGMSTLKVDNLTYRTTPEALRKVFDKFGDIGDIYIPRDYRTKESRGFAFVR